MCFQILYKCKDCPNTTYAYTVPCAGGINSHIALGGLGFEKVVMVSLLQCQECYDDEQTQIAAIQEMIDEEVEKARAEKLQDIVKKEDEEKAAVEKHILKKEADDKAAVLQEIIKQEAENKAAVLMEVAEKTAKGNAATNVKKMTEKAAMTNTAKSYIVKVKNESP